MRLCEFVRPELVIRRLEATDAEGVVAQIAAGAEAAGFGERAEIQELLLARERLHPTVMGMGLAIPHATTPSVPEPAVGVALAGPQGIHFGAPGQEPVRVFFTLLSPPGHEGLHLKLLARVCRLVQDPELLPRLEAATGPDEILALIQAADTPEP